MTFSSSLCRTAWIGAALLAASVAFPSVSRADLISDPTFPLTSDHCTGGCGTPPFGTVTVTQDGANVDFVVALASGINWAKTGAADFLEFKFNDPTGFTGSTVNQTFAGQTLALQTASPPGSFNGDGTGAFSFGIACTTCGNGNLGITSNISFTLNNTTVAAVTQPNA